VQLNSISPEAVNEAIVDRHVRDLEARTPICDVACQRTGVTAAWHRLIVLKPGLSKIAGPARAKPWRPGGDFIKSTKGDVPKRIINLVFSEGYMVGAAGFEPTTCSTQNCRATRLRYTPIIWEATSIHA
jgi:hypothetical protein